MDLCEKTQNAFATIGIHPCRAIEPRIAAKLPKKGEWSSKDDTALEDYINQIDAILA
jgi:Tat protein secretion system quality control protein TatD with DNase activity